MFFIYIDFSFIYTLYVNFIILKTNILSQILECWHLDIKFLDDLLDDYQINLDIEDIKLNFWKIDINTLIYSALEEVKNQFIDENQEKLEKSWFDIYSIDYEIYTNYMDSHIWFNDDKVDNLYQEWRK